MIYWISVFVLKIFSKIYLRGEVYGKENFPAKGPYIGILNHSSNMDVVAMALAVRQKVYTMAKDSLFKVPVLKWWLKAVGMFPVIRNTTDHRAFNYAIGLLKQKKVLFMAPEGTRKKNKDQVIPPKSGFIRMAQIVGCPVVPVALSGTGEVLPPGAWFPRSVKVKVNVGKPIYLEKLDSKHENKQKIQQQAEQVMAEVYRLLAEIEN